MTLPNQPASPLDVIGNEEFFRIRQPVGSPGDIYEVDSSTRAIYLGPESDVSEVRIAYYDTQAARSMNIAAISAGGPFVNRLDSLLKTQYPGIGQAGRILAYPLDIVDPAYVRPVETPAQTPIRSYALVPYVDLICALKEIPSIPQVRPDKTYRLKVPMNNAATDSDTDDGSTDIVIPIYGRRMASVMTITPANVPHITSFFFVALPPGVAPVAKLMGRFTTTDSAFAKTESAPFRASDQTNGISTGTTSTPTTTAGQTNFPLDSAKGMADLLVLNFAPNFTPPAPDGYSMLDVIVRVSDREEG